MDDTRITRRRRARRHPAGRAGAAVVAGLVLLAGCGGDEAPTGDAGAPTTSEESPAGPAATEQDTESSDTMTSTETMTSPTTSEDGEEEAAEDVVITISDYEYTVPETVSPGATITVRNEDSVGHTVTSDEEGLFDVGVPAGEEVTMTVPEEAGEFSFFCKPHPYMTGTLVVG